MERYTALVMLLVITFGAAFLLGAVNVRHDWHGSVYYFSGTSNSLQNTSNNYTSAGAYTAYGVTAPNGKDYSSSIKVSPGYSNGTVYYSNSGAQAAASFPPAVEYYIPIRLDNAQNISTEAPFQQEIYVNSSKYAYLQAGVAKNISILASKPVGSIVPYVILVVLLIILAAAAWYYTRSRKHASTKSEKKAPASVAAGKRDVNRSSTGKAAANKGSARGKSRATRRPSRKRSGSRRTSGKRSTSRKPAR